MTRVASAGAWAASAGRSVSRSPRWTGGGSRRAEAIAAASRSWRSLSPGHTRQDSQRTSSSRVTSSGLRSSPARQVMSGTRAGSGTGPRTAQRSVGASGSQPAIR